METSSLLIILLLVGIFGATLWWHLRENRRLEEALRQTKLDTVTIDWLIRFAWSRTIQLLVAAAFGIIIFVCYDWEVTETRDAVVMLNDALEKQQATAAQARAQQMPAATQTATAIPQPATKLPAPQTMQPVQNAAQGTMPQQNINPALLSSTPTNNTADAFYPPVATPSETPSSSPAAPVVLSTPGAAEQPDANTLTASEGSPEAATEALDQNLANEGTDTPEITPPPATVSRARTLEQVYNPERTNGDDQSSMDDIKKRYEDILVIYMFLKQCNRIDANDYNIIMSALAQEMASVNAPGRMQADIVGAARGSYQEIYAQSPCDGNGIKNLVRQYHQYIEALKNNFPPE